MTPLLAIIRMRLVTLRNALRNVRKDVFAKSFVVVFGLANVVFLGLVVSFKSFEFIERIPAFGVGLNAKIIGLLFFSLLILVMLSTIIVAYTSLFLAQETRFLFQHPVPPRAILLTKLVEAVAFSSWATLFLGYPVLISFGYLREASWPYYLQAGGILVTFLLFAGFSGAGVALLVAPVVRRLSPRHLLIASVLTLVLLSWIFFRSFQLGEMDGDNNLLILDRVASNLPLLDSAYFPGQWASRGVLAAAAGNHSDVLFHGGTLIANTAIFFPVLLWYGKHHYVRQFLKSRRSTPRGKGLSTKIGQSISRGPTSALILKDVLVFIRDPAQLSQSLLFVLLMVIYSSSLAKVPGYLLTAGTHLATVLYFANLGAICTILSSFTTRFLFPLISLEGKAFWIIGLAPIDRAAIVHQKTQIGLYLTLTMGLAATFLSNWALGYPTPMLLAALYTIALAAVCLSALATGLGAAYPNFEEDNPARIAVGLGGTLNFFASALAVATLLGIQALPYVLHSLRLPRTVVAIGAHLLSLIFTLYLVRFCLKLGCRTLRRSQF